MIYFQKNFRFLLKNNYYYYKIISVVSGIPLSCIIFTKISILIFFRKDIIYNLYGMPDSLFLTRRPISTRFILAVQ